jgi:hypothetical protein
VVLRRRARKRGVIALEDFFSMAALMACFVGPIAVAARSVGPKLANDMDERVRTISAQEAGGGAANGASNGLDFGPVLGSQP